jgi:uncharacterized protein
MSDPTPTNIDQWLLETLRCPLTHSPLRHEHDREGEWLVADRGGLRYPIRDGIPVMLVEEARLPAGVQSIDQLKRELGM